MAEVERRRRRVLLELVEVLGAGRAPGQHPRRARQAEAMEGAMADALVGRQVGFLELVDAAAVRRAADDVEVEAERVEDVHHVEHDVRRPQHVAAGVEQHLDQPLLGRLLDAAQRLRRQLHAGEQAHRLRHVAEAPGGVGGADLGRARRLQPLQPRDRHPLADVDVLGAGRGAAGAAVAGAEPALQVVGRGGAGGQRHEVADALLRQAGIEADLARRRAGGEAGAAAGAAVGGLAHQRLQSLGVAAHRSPPKRTRTDRRRGPYWRPRRL